jgi:hypothetical protein
MTVTAFSRSSLELELVSIHGSDRRLRIQSSVLAEGMNLEQGCEESEHS